jgi:diguanylate cyclase (GGDEF)-like protein/PAS domain S-box-containing protein
MKHILTSSSDISILYVEDEPETREMVSRVLAMQLRSLQLYTAENGEAGLALYREHRPDIVITDFNMPLMDGIRMGNEIKSLNPEAIIIAVTAHSDTSYLLDAIETGISNYVLKPIDYDKLFEAIAKGIETVKMKRVVQEQNDYIRKLSRAVEASPCSVVITDGKGVIEYVNPKFTELTGYSSEEAIGQNPRILKSNRVPSKTYEELWATITTGREWRGEFLNLKKNGELYWESASISPIFNDQDAITHFVAVKEDITERKRAEKALRESEERFRNILENAPIGMSVMSLEGRFMLVNSSLCELVGYKKEELEKLTFQEITHPEDLEPHLANVQRLLDGSITSFNMEKRYIRKDRQIVWAQLTSSVIRDSDGVPMYLVAQIEDISDRRRSQEQIHLMAYYDALTGLPNRRLLLDRLNHALAQARRYQRSMALLFLDLDNFKHVNDTMGHDIGDELLKVVAGRLQACVRAVDTVCRQGGDEFIIVLTEIAHLQGVAVVANKIIEAISEPISLQEKELRITTSIGIAVYSVAGTDDEKELMKKADSAMYEAKDKGGNGFMFYHSECPQVLPP